MTLEGLIANYEDLKRLERLEKEGHLKPGFALEARRSLLRYLVRIAQLSAVFALIPYVGPTVTMAEAKPNMVQVQLLSEDANTVIATVEVPGNDANFPTVGVVVYKGEYFIGPSMPPHAAMNQYIRVEGFVVAKNPSPAPR